HPGIDRVLRRIEVDFAQSWDNAAMARIAGLSESHFKAMFRKITGNPPAETLARKRVDL
ncbi:MAG: helix-turn-helix transcriptional regulator, partial [Akkermansiaceae bacterium]|nr:helix-turn-helix transcriptional regulator [Akkermansiaceae bacterium]NIY14945.1 AraC family transcriptional regulator [Nitrospinaceae bacterium]